MHKLVILFEQPEDSQAFDDVWPKFLHLVEEMPGLRREAISRVESFMFGSSQIAQMHELYFDTFEEAQQAMASPQGQAAGQMLQEMTGGQMTLFIADHKEDNLSRIQRYRTKPVKHT
ncbi:MAG TPA: EthD family reductase [Anaerolineales bacterium]|nr:EthD family reductase [Anaerolineales bacterium]